MRPRAVANSVMVLFSAVAACLLLQWLACAVVSSEHAPDTEEMARASGYRAETHKVVTEDGYVLGVHRIRPRPDGPRRPPVLLQHGIFHSSADYVVMGPHHALGYVLSDGGYDVWLGNSRGNVFSRQHVNLSVNEPEFWNFSFVLVVEWTWESYHDARVHWTIGRMWGRCPAEILVVSSWHEMGKYDEPAVIDYILNATGHKDLFYVGHSMGAAIFLVMMHARPEYNEKIRLMFGLAPASYMHHGRSPITIPFFKYMHTSKDVLDRLGVLEVLRRDSSWQQLASSTCASDRLLMQSACTRIIGQVFGHNQANLNKTTLDVNLRYFPAGSSRKAAAHFGQNIIAGKFLQFDYGPDGNLAKYGQRQPLSYDLDKVAAPVSLYCGGNDLIVDCKDVELLFSDLTHCADKNLTYLQEYSHVDFLWGVDAKSRLYDGIVSRMNQY